MATYATLKELVDAIREERESDVVAVLDNDQVTFRSPAEDDVDLLELHPSELQEQALALLGFTTEWV